MVQAHVNPEPSSEDQTAGGFLQASLVEQFTTAWHRGHRSGYQVCGDVYLASFAGPPGTPNLLTVSAQLESWQSLKSKATRIDLQSHSCRMGTHSLFAVRLR